MKNLFTPVKEYNLSLQKRAQELNVRAGAKFFPVYTKEEMKVFLLDKLKGAVNLQTVPNMEALKLPNLDESLIVTTEQSNPLMIVIADSECPVAYMYSSGTYYAKATIEESIARAVEAGIKIEFGSLEGDQEKLQLLTLGGRILTLVSNGVEATNFQELVQKLETKRIERAWSDKKSELEHTSWISNPTDVFPRLATILQKVEITKADNGEGEAIFGWVYLDSDSDPDFKVLLTDDEGKAKEQTQLGLKRLLAKATKEDRKVPQEMPWFDSSGWSGSKTELGNALATAMESLPEEFIPETPADAETAIELLKERIAEIKVELAGVFEEARQKIQSVREQIEEIQDTEYANDELSEIRELLSQAEMLLKSGKTDEAMTEQGKAGEIVGSLSSIIEKRKEAEASLLRKGVEREKAIQEHLDAEYRTCPVSNQEIGGNIWLSGGDMEKVRLFNGGEYGETIVLKSSHIGKSTLVELVAKFNDRYNEYQVLLNVTPEAWEEGEVIVVNTHFLSPTEEEVQAATEINDLKRRIAYVKEEEERSDRISLKFQKSCYKGKDSLQASCVFEGVQTLFVVNTNMMDGVVPGEAWICSIGRQIGTSSKGNPILIANPQIRNDLGELGRQLKVAEARMVSERTASVEKKNNKEEEGISSESLQALLEKFRK